MPPSDTGLSATELGHVCQSEPGDLVIFDQRCFHAAFGGVDGRRMCSSVFYERPRTEEEVKKLTDRAAIVNAAIASTHPGRPAYGERWVANEAGSERRARWIGELRRLGFLPMPDEVVVAGDGSGSKL